MDLFTALFTAIAVMAAAIAFLVVYAAVRKLEQADAMVIDLDKRLRELGILRIDVDSLDKRLRRLAGTVYSPPGTNRKPRDLEHNEDGDELPSALNGLDPDLAATLALQKAGPAGPTGA